MFDVRKRTLGGLCLCFALFLCDACGQQSFATEHGKKWETTGSIHAPIVEPPDVQQYCSNVAATVTAAKIARQEAKLHEIEELMKRRRDELESKRQELQQLIEKHEALIHKADETLIKMYSRMKPDAAAAQFATLDDEVATSLLIQLNPKISSAILNEMNASRGAILIKKLAANSSLSRSGKSP